MHPMKRAAGGLLLQPAAEIGLPRIASHARGSSSARRRGGVGGGASRHWQAGRACIASQPPFDHSSRHDRERRRGVASQAACSSIACSQQQRQCKATIEAASLGLAGGTLH
eukprot:COSAG01_NODE_15123_length_1372_cov_1.706991_1_plen_111_part_00